jgi:ribonuclease-3
MMNLHFSRTFYEDFFPQNQQYKIEELNHYFKQFPELKNLLASFDLEFLENEIWLQTFIHKSFSHESKFKKFHNERLEFLGDSVLQLIITEELSRRHPEASEGELSKMRSFLVNAKQLSIMSLYLDLPRFILVGRGEFKKGILALNVLADTFEAFVGAIYLTYGFAGAKKFILKLMENLEFALAQSLWSLENLSEFDARSKLQEIFMAEFGVLPEFITSSEDQRFKAELKFQNKIYASSFGNSKKSAIKTLSENCLEEKIWNKLKETLC